MSYREDMDFALKKLSFALRPRMKVGIVGRTGAGKSSILQCIFRLLEVDSRTGGCVVIDGTDTRTLGLHTLRNSLAYIP